MFPLYMLEADEQDSSDLSLIHIYAVQNIAKLFEELNFENIHQQFYAFCYLLWNGYFSVNGKYAYNSVDILDEKNTVFLGRGCCRHNAELLSEVLTQMDLLAKEIGVRTSKIKLKDIIDIETSTERESYEEKKYKYARNEYDHSVTLVSNYNEVFMLDPTMLVECEIIKNAKVVCYNGKYKVRRKLLMNELWVSRSYSSNATISRDVLVNNYKEAKSICSASSKLINDFYDDNHSNYEKINRLVLSKFR